MSDLIFELEAEFRGELAEIFAREAERRGLEPAVLVADVLEVVAEKNAFQNLLGPPLSALAQKSHRSVILATPVRDNSPIRQPTPDEMMRGR